MFDIFANKKIIITGHTGFKGSWLVAILSKYSKEIYGLSLDVPTSPSHYNFFKKKVQNRNFIDIRDRKKVEYFINKIKPDFIFHFAAQPIVLKSFIDPILTYETNILGTANLLNSLRFLKKKCTSIIITSDKCYENLEKFTGYKESDRLGGSDPYSSSKAAAELVAQSYFRSFFSSKNTNIKIGIARAGNVIGGGDWARDRIVPDCIRNWSNNKKAIIRNPNSIRPWQHVLEPLSGYITFAKYLYYNQIKSGHSFNFGPKYTNDHSVKDLVIEISKFWPNAKWKKMNGSLNQKYESKLLKLNCKKALKYLNWQSTLNFAMTAEYTSLWYKEYYNYGILRALECTNNQIESYMELFKKKNNKIIN